MINKQNKKKYNLITMTYKDLKDMMFENKLPLTVADNIYKDIHKWQKNDIEELTLNFYRKELLNNIAFIGNSLKLEKKVISEKGNCIKYIFKLFDNEIIESVAIILPNKITICISSQVGCSLSCDFCATGKMGMVRNLNIEEIILQVYNIKKDIKKDINNVVYMGMGEPLLNYENVLKSAYILNENLGMNLGSDRISISTAGIIPQMEKFILNEEPFHLILSLHSIIQEKREKIMPIAKKYTIDYIKYIIELHNKKRKKDWLTLAYIMIKNFNMEEKDSDNLINFLKNKKCKLNFIPYNDVNSNIKYDAPNEMEIYQFCEKFKKLNIPVNIRKTIGQDIKGACGQLIIKEKAGV